MGNNIFAKTYNEMKKAENDFFTATDDEGRKAAKALYRQAIDIVDGFDYYEGKVWEYYRTAKKCGNEYIDIFGNLNSAEVEQVVACLRENGIEAVTFSSTWSNSIETAWLFQEAGCSLIGLVEINSHYHEIMSEEYEKKHGYLFKVN